MSQRVLILTNLFLTLALLCVSLIPFFKNNPAALSVGGQNFKYDDNKSEKKYHWPKQSLPIVVAAPLGLKSLIERDYIDSCETWNRALGRKILSCVFEDFDGTHPMKKSPKLNRLYFTKDWASVYKYSDRLAITRRIPTMTLGSTIAHANIVFNMKYDFYFRSSLISMSEVQYEFKRVLIHELGHFLGLEHESDGNSVMKDTVSNNDPFTDLKNVDIESIRKKYKQ